MQAVNVTLELKEGLGNWLCEEHGGAATTSQREHLILDILEQATIMLQTLVYSAHHKMRTSQNYSAVTRSSRHCRQSLLENCPWWSMLMSTKSWVANAFLWRLCKLYNTTNKQQVVAYLQNLLNKKGQVYARCTCQLVQSPLTPTLHLQKKNYFPKFLTITLWSASPSSCRYVRFSRK